MDLTGLTTSSLSRRDAFCLIIALGFATHLVFNRLEPRKPSLILTILIGLPGALSTTLLPYFDHWVFVIVVAFSTYYLVLSVSVIGYRLSPFHPLARYPGPILHKISKLWVASIDKKGKTYIHLQKLHQKYGDVIRIGPNELFIRDVSVIVPLYGTNGLPKGPRHEGLSEHSMIPNIVGIRDRQVHMRRRVYWQRGLNTAAIKGYEPIISHRAALLVERLGACAGSTVDLSMMMSYFSYDFMSDMAFGGGSEMLREGDVMGLWKFQNDGITSGALLGRLPWLAPFVSLFFGPTDNSKFRKYGMEKAEKRRNEGSQTKDLFYHLIDEGGIDKEPPSLSQVLSDGSVAIIAGSDTTAVVLSNLFFFLMSNRQVFALLQAEVDKFYPPDEDGLSTKFHGDMPYLSACINESLRLLPPAPAGSQRACYKGMGPKMIGSYYIPEGTAVTANFYSIHRDPRYFSPGTEVFWPERWLITEKKDYVALPSSPSLSPSSTSITRPKDFVHNMDAFVPFSYGPANCVGKFLALQEMRIVVCYVVQKLDMRFADGYESGKWLEDLKEYSILVRGRLPVVVTPRN